MTKKEIIDIVTSNKGERITDIYNKLYDKQKELNKRNDRLAIYMFGNILFYFIASKATITGIQFGPVGLTDFSIVIKLSPILFAYLMVEYSLINAHRAEVTKLLKWIALMIHNQTITDKDVKDSYFNDLTRLILPYSLAVEMARLNDYNNNFKWIDALIILPLTFIVLFPIFFEFVAIRHVILYQWSDWLGKGSVILSIWLIFVLIYFYAKLISRSRENDKKELV